MSQKDFQDLGLNKLTGTFILYGVKIMNNANFQPSFPDTTSRVSKACYTAQETRLQNNFIACENITRHL